WSAPSWSATTRGQSPARQVRRGSPGSPATTRSPGARPPRSTTIAARSSPRWCAAAAPTCHPRGRAWAATGAISRADTRPGCFRRAAGVGATPPPPATGAAGIVDLMRNMIVAAGRDTLELALGADPAWWRGTRLARAPTRFGVLDVTLDAPAPDRRRARWTA